MEQSYVNDSLLMLKIYSLFISFVILSITSQNLKVPVIEKCLINSFVFLLFLKVRSPETPMGKTTNIRVYT